MSACVFFNGALFGIMEERERLQTAAPFPVAYGPAGRDYYEKEHFVYSVGVVDFCWISP